MVNLFEVRAYSSLCGAIIKQCYKDIEKDSKNRNKKQYKNNNKCVRQSVYAYEAERCLNSEWGRLLMDFYLMGIKLDDNATAPKHVKLH